MTALHIVLVIYVPWLDSHTIIGGPAFVPFGLLDAAVIYGCFKLVERLVSKNT